MKYFLFLFGILIVNESLLSQCKPASTCFEVTEDHTLNVQFTDIVNESTLQKSTLDICFTKADLGIRNVPGYFGPTVSTWVKLNLPSEGEILFITTRRKNSFTQAEMRVFSSIQCPGVSIEATSSGDHSPQVVAVVINENRADRLVEIVVPVTQVEFEGEESFTIESWVTPEFEDCLNSGLDGLSGNFFVSNVERSIGVGQERLYPGEDVSFQIFSFEVLPEDLHSITPIIGEGLEVSKDELLNLVVTPDQIVEPYLEEGDCSLRTNEDLPSFCVFTDDNGLERLCNMNLQTCPCEEGIKANDPLPYSWKGVDASFCGDCPLGVVEGFSFFANTEMNFRVSDDPDKSDVSLGFLFSENGLTACNDETVDCRPQVGVIGVDFGKRIEDPVAVEITTTETYSCNTIDVDFQIEVENYGLYDSLVLRHLEWNTAFDSGFSHRITSDTTVTASASNIGTFASTVFFHLVGYLNGEEKAIQDFGFLVDGKFTSEVWASAGVCGDQCYELTISTQNDDIENLTYLWFDGSDEQSKFICPGDISEDIFVIVDNSPCGKDTFYFDFDEPITYDLEYKEVVCFQNIFFPTPQEIAVIKNISGGIPSYDLVGEQNIMQIFSSNDSILSIYPFFGVNDTIVPVEIYVRDAIGCRSEIESIDLAILNSKYEDYGQICQDGNFDMDNPDVVLSIPETIIPHTQIEWIDNGSVEGVAENNKYIINEEMLPAGDHWKTAHVYYDDECYVSVDFFFKIIENERQINYSITDFEVDFEPLTALGITSLFWDFGDGSTSEEYFPTHIYNSPGEYVVSLTIVNDCGEWTSTQTIVVGGVTAYEEPNDVKVVLAPNPASTTLSVTTDKEIDNLVIYDFHGVEVASLASKQVLKTRAIDVSSLPGGVYLVLIQSEGTYITEKVVIVR